MPYFGSPSDAGALIDFLNQLENQIRGASVNSSGDLVFNTQTIRQAGSLPISFADGIGPIGFLSQAYGFNPTSLKNWRKALARVRAGTGRARAIFAGDSTTAGIGAQDSTGRMAQSFPAYAQLTMAGLGVTSVFNSVLGNGNVGIYGTYNPKLPLTAGWGFSSSNTVGGPLFVNGSTTNGLVFSPSGNIDTIEFYCQKNTGNGIISYQVDAGGTTNIDQNAADAVVKTVVSAGSPGTHTFTLARVSGSTVNMCALIAYDSTTPAVDVCNAGIGSSTTNSWVVSTTTRSPLPMMTNLSPDLIVIDLGINDYTPATLVPVATMQANLQTMITTWGAFADIILVLPVPSDASRQTLAIQSQYTQAITATAKANNVPVIDMVSRWQSYVTSNALGYYFDTVHPTQLGYAEMGQFMGRLLASV